MNSTRRIVQYLFGLFIMTLGIAFSLKSNLGSTPISSIPYSMELIWGIEVGLATSIFSYFNIQCFACLDRAYYT